MQQIIEIMFDNLTLLLLSLHDITQLEALFFLKFGTTSVTSILRYVADKCNKHKI